MMKLNKVYIENFKGIKEKKILDLSDNTTLLIGPNGFGKTTVFDVLEYCITGKLYRTKAKEKVTKDTSNYKKPFYQNTEKKDVIIKVWLKKEDKDLIIVRYLDKNHSGCSDGKGRKNKPCDFDLMKSFKGTPDNFESNIINENSHNELCKTEINDFFEIKEKDITIQNVYKLFNYLQQEEATFFLRQSEQERKDSLSFLFQTTNQEKKRDNIQCYLYKLENIKNELEKKINKSEINEIIKKEYCKLFENKDFKFDKEDPYSGLKIEEVILKRDFYLHELKEISEFKNFFSPTEYNKKVKFNKINQIIKNEDFLDYLNCKRLLDKKIYTKNIKHHELYSNDNLLKIFILKNFLPKYEDLQKINETIISYKNFMAIEGYEKKILKLHTVSNGLLDEKEKKIFDIYMCKKNKLQETSDELSKAISSILVSRDELSNIFSSFKEKLESNSCPFCGSKWKNYDELIQNFNLRAGTLKSINKNTIEDIEKIDNQIINELINPLELRIKNFCRINFSIDNRILELLKQNVFNKDKLEELSTIFNVEQNAWTEIKEYEKLEKDFQLLKECISKRLVITTEALERLKTLYGKSFDDTDEYLKTEFPGINLIMLILEDKNNSISDIEKNRKRLISILERERENYIYQADRAEDNGNMYEIYFNSKEEDINKLKKDDIKIKIDYLNAKKVEKESLVLDKIISRKDKLKKVINQLSNLKDFYDKEIKDYKKEMVEKIKIPFYIYTSKILQNYQQGMGVFLYTKENSDSIRFLTDSSSDHDAMHHLSSGQLAVVALSFCLAINKTYNISENLKFLVIDDPIQEMDSLNIHSFIELIRHEFASEYQMIFSTHSDSSALYMKYKLEMLQENSVKLINVQKLFFD